MKESPSSPHGTAGEAALFGQRTVVRYAFAVGVVLTALGLRLLLIPLTGTGAPFVLFFAAILVTSLVAGVGPAVWSLVASLPLAAYLFVVRGGYPPSQAVYQILLYGVDGMIVIYLTGLARRRERSLDTANRLLQRADAERARVLERARDTIELAPDAFFLADLDARYTHVNQAACELLGYERHELIGMTIFDLIRVEDAERLINDRAAMLTPGVVRKSEWTLKRKDGTLVPVEVSAKIIPDGRWQAFVRDITVVRRSIEERDRLLASGQKARRELLSLNARLSESEERFRLTIDEAPIGMALVQLDGRWMRVNRMFCEITGYTADELARLTFQDITHPDDLDTDLELAEQLVRGTIPRYQLAKRYIRKDGSFVHVMLSVSMLRGPDGEPRCYISQVEDVTERIEAEEALRLSEGKFSGIVSIAAEAIISVDESQRITIFNEGAERIFGYSKGEAIGMTLDRLIPERSRRAHAAHFSGFAAAGESARTMGGRLEILGVRKNGEEFPAEASISKVTVAGVTLFSAVLRDVTARRQVEHALERAVVARDQVLGVVAHDLRNPLTTIMLEASLVGGRGRMPERRDQSSRELITRSARRMSQLIADLLDVTSIEAGKLRIAPSRVATAGVLRDAIESHTLQAGSAGVRLVLKAPPQLGDVWGDPKRLHQVFDNLIGNATSFTPPGGSITVTATSRETDVMFSIADTGPGIAPDQLPRVFDRFWQATDAANRTGAGLGLAITHGIVEAHGGRIWVESTPGEGSVFSFTIPTAVEGV